MINNGPHANRKCSSTSNLLYTGGNRLHMPVQSGILIRLYLMCKLRAGRFFKLQKCLAALDMCGELWDEPFRRWSCRTTVRPNYAPLGPLGPANYQESIMIPSGIHQSGCEAPIAIPPPSLSSRHAWVGDKLLKRPLCTEVNHTQQYSTDFVALKSARVIISNCIFMYSTPTVRRRK